MTSPTIVPASITPYRESAPVPRLPEGIQEHRERGISIIDIRYHVGRQATLAALANATIWLLMPLLLWLRGRQALAESLILGVAIFAFNFFLWRWLNSQRTQRIELLPDGVRVLDVDHPFADLRRFDVEPSGSSKRRRLTSTPRTGARVDIADGLLPEQAEYLRARITDAAEAARRFPTGG